MHDVLQCKSIIEYLAQEMNNNLCHLMLARWCVLKELRVVLQAPYKATIKLQNRSLTLSDTYGIWLKIQICLNDLEKTNICKTNFIHHLIEALNKRKQVIFDNPAMICALYLDPRFHREILSSREKTEQAITMLSNVWNRIQIIHQFESEQHEERVNTVQNCSTGSSELNVSIDFDNSLALDEYLSSNESQVNRMVISSTDIRTELELFSPERMKPDESILLFWESSKIENKRLYEIAKVIYAIPPTEVDIERDFSKLNFIFTQRRQCLSEELLESILVIHLNSDLFYTIKNEELNAENDI